MLFIFQTQFWMTVKETYFEFPISNLNTYMFSRQLIRAVYKNREHGGWIREHRGHCPFPRQPVTTQDSKAAQKNPILGQIRVKPVGNEKVQRIPDIIQYNTIIFLEKSDVFSFSKKNILKSDPHKLWLSVKNIGFSYNVTL